MVAKKWPKNILPNGGWKWWLTIKSNPLKNYPKKTGPSEIFKGHSVGSTAHTGDSSGIFGMVSYGSGFFEWKIVILEVTSQHPGKGENTSKWTVESEPTWENVSYIGGMTNSGCLIISHYLRDRSVFSPTVEGRNLAITGCKHPWSSTWNPKTST